MSVFTVVQSAGKPSHSEIAKFYAGFMTEQNL